MLVMKRSIGILLALSLWLVSLPALAQIDEAMRLIEDADFAGAIAAFDRAEATATLDRPALLRLLSGRAMAAWATGDEAHARRDLVSLASIEPGYQLPPEAPPDLGAAFNDAVSETEPLALTARWETQTPSPLLVRSDKFSRAKKTAGHWSIPVIPLTSSGGSIVA